jgi:hypothetical protein
MQQEELIMKARILAAVVLALGFAGSARAAQEDFFRGTLDLKQAVRLGDGSVLSAGKYDVKIDYKGFGGSAEFLFLQGGVLKGRTPAEARGFSSQAPAGAGKTVSDESPKETANDKSVKLDQAVKLDPAAQKGTQANFPKVDAGDKSSPAGGATAFAWSAHGFNAGAQGKVVPTGKSLKISFDSANSAAGFSALVPAVQK